MGYYLHRVQLRTIRITTSVLADFNTEGLAELSLAWYLSGEGITAQFDRGVRAAQDQLDVSRPSADGIGCEYL